ncbi:MAG: T9SS type A sorting domain-containing protein [Flavobacteriales bacterium]|nr:T9SS type A sorting domain-containing protein [Flavobacteriales bacterium]
MKKIFIIILFLPTLVFSQYKGGSGDGYSSVDVIVEGEDLVLDNVIDNNIASVYPNPFSDSFTITLSEINTKGTTVKIFNVNGVLIGKVPFNNSKLEYNSSSLSKGIYFAQIWQNNKLLSVKKVIKN